MVKIKLPVNVCCEGDIIADDILGDRGVLLATENTVISDTVKTGLNNLGVEYIWIFKPSGEMPGDDDRSEFNIFQKEYESDINASVQISRDLAKGRSINMDDLNKLSDSIYLDSSSNTCISFLNQIELFDHALFRHSLNVSFYSALICKWLKINEKKTKNIIKTGLLHDLGKIDIPLELMNKEGKLQNYEFDMIKCHALYGFNYLKDIAEIDSDIKLGVLTHHERLDGSGYPFGYSNKQLNHNAKIIAVADTYDALTSDRPYKKRQTPFKAIEILLRECIATYDTTVFNSSTSNLLYYFIGSRVLLNNGEEGVIVHIPLHNITKPIVYVNQVYIDLSKEADLHIVSMI